MRIGIMGCANIAQRMVIPAIDSMDQWQLVAVASRDSEKAMVFAEKFACEAVTGYDALIQRNDIDALYIPLPPGLHHEWTLKALAKGKHCLVEKPLGCDLASTKEMIEAASSNQLALFENYMFIHHSQHRFVKERITAGEIGEVRNFRASFGFPPLPKDNFRYNTSLGGGVLLDAGGYPIKAAQHILGKDGPLKLLGSHLNIDPETGADVTGGAFLVSPRGVTVQVAFGFDNFYQCNYEVWGSKGKIIAHRAYTAGPGVEPKVVIEKQGEFEEFVLPEDNHFANILAAFHQSIIKKEFQSQYDQILEQARLIQEVKSYAR
jgi:dTDP-3,4-didehydro-2,6-dideoxy-alpha-D-glucose 3-reductase